MVEYIVISFFVFLAAALWISKQSFLDGYRKGYNRGDLDATLRRVDRELPPAPEAQERSTDSAIDNPPLSR